MSEIDTMPFVDRSDERAIHAKSITTLGVSPGAPSALYRRKVLATIDLMRAQTEFLVEKGLSETFKQWVKDRSRFG